MKCQTITTIVSSKATLDLGGALDFAEASCMEHMP